MLTQQQHQSRYQPSRKVPRANILLKYNLSNKASNHIFLATILIFLLQRRNCCIHESVPRDAFAIYNNNKQF